MFEGCPSITGEPQSVNPPHYGRWWLDCLIIIWWSTTCFRSDSNQNFCLANPILPRLLCAASQIAKFMGPTWGPPGSRRPQMGPMLAPLTLLSGRSLVFTVCSMTQSCKNMASLAAGGCQGVAQPEFRGPPQNSTKHSCLPLMPTSGSN